jgi:ceramide glucosyltransferase
MGTLVSSALGKRVAVAHRPIENVSARRGLREFASRHARWSVLQRQAVGRLPYVAQLLLNPILLAVAGALLQPTWRSVALLVAVCAVRAAVDGGSVALLRPEGLRLRHLALVPLKDLVVGAAWCWGLVRRDVAWRGNRILVGPGTRIEVPEEERLEVARA